MKLVALEEQRPAFIIRMKGEGAFHPLLLSELEAALNIVEAASPPAGLVITGEGKFFSTGFDLDAFFKGGSGERESLMHSAVQLLGRLLAFPVPAVAAINGHAFGMGAMAALACDYRCMRADRGYFCLPEVDLKVAIPPGMMALLKLKIDHPALRDLLFTGKRIGADEALRLGIVDEACSLEALLPGAIARAAALAHKDRETYAAMKRGLNQKALSIIECSSKSKA